MIQGPQCRERHARDSLTDTQPDAIFRARYDPWVVALSVAIASFASYVALDLAKRVRTDDRRVAVYWLIGGSGAMGTGIWSMHFVGMLSFKIPITLGYTPVLTGVSWLAAVGASVIALSIAGQRALGARRLSIGAMTMGAGIFVMHYTGMAALDMSPGIVWSPPLIAASFAIAVVASGAALLIFVWLRRFSGRRSYLYQGLAAIVMGLAISAMHYTGMAAASFTIGSICRSAGMVGGDSLGSIIAISSVTLLAITLLTSILDARMQSKTERLVESLKAANAGLHHERERFRALTELSADWFWEQDKDLRFTNISAGFGAGTSRTASDYLGKHRWDLSWVDVDDETWRKHREQLERRESFHDFEVRFLDVKGRLRVGTSSGLPAYDETGEFTGYRGVGRDITERREQELRVRELEVATLSAEEASRAKSLFLATMSHEIRTPMNGVIGMIDVLSHSDSAEDKADAVRTIRASALTLLALIDDILDFAKIEAGELGIERVPVALTELVESACHVHVPAATARRVELGVFVDPSLPDHIWSDPTRLQQTLSNLISNAIKFSQGRPGDPGRVMVRLERSREAPPRMVLSVIDNGIGMTAATLALLFRPFVQGEASTTRRFGGTGLGLIISKRLVTLMGGEIAARSEAGAGSTFTVTLPIDAVELPANRAYPDLSGLNCIVIEGHTVDDADLRAYLEHAGARVFVARGASDAALMRADKGKTAVIIQQTGPALDAPVVRVDRQLRRSTLLRAVARAAGRESPAAVPQVGDVVPARRIAPGVAQARLEGRLVLVAEDDPVNQKVILRQLALLGYAAEVAVDGTEALKLWRTGGHALLLSDLHMPELDGYGLAASIRAAESGRREGGRMPILALTANALRDEASRVLAAGMDEYLTKPIQLAALGAALERWLPHSAAADSRTLSDQPATSVTPDVAVDVSILRNLVGDDVDSIHELLADYLQSARGQATEILAAFTSADLARIGSVAHALKASSRAVGALALGDLCDEFEDASRSGGMAAMGQRQAQFETMMSAADACIVAILAEPVNG